jgi:hypothetical protein
MAASSAWGELARRQGARRRRRNSLLRRLVVSMAAVAPLRLERVKGGKGMANDTRVWALTAAEVFVLPKMTPGRRMVMSGCDLPDRF